MKRLIHNKKEIYLQDNICDPIKFYESLKTAILDLDLSKQLYALGDLILRLLEKKSINFDSHLNKP